MEGNAHVKVNADNTHWRGYILIPPTPRDVLYFNTVPWSVTEVVYEGPVLFKGKYHFGRGTAHIQMVKDTSQELRVDFFSDTEFRMAGLLEEQPSDFIVD
jgi:hypothetical protein